MRQVIFGGANSLDNYITGPGESIDWILFGDEAAALMADYWARFDTLVMGRKTYEFAARSGGGGGSPGVKSYVFSRTLPPGPRDGVEFVAGDPAAFVRRLKGEPGKDICVFGGGELGTALLEAGGVIDEIGFNVHPVLLGGGVPLFLPMRRRVSLELLECRPFKNGTVLVRYRVKD
jgi:dihydrofolate reductase